MADTRLRLGQLLVDARMLTQQALDDVLALQRTDGRRLGTLLVEKRLINETQLTQILSHQLSVPWVSLLHVEFSRQLLNLVPHEVAEKYCLVPIYVRHVRGQGDTLYVAMNDPTNEEALSECATFSGLPVRAMIAPPSDIVNAIRVYYGGVPPQQAAPTPAPSVPPSSDAPRARRSERPPRSRPPPAETPEASPSAPPPARSTPPAATSTPPAAISTPPPATRSAPPAASSTPPPAALQAESSEDSPTIEAVELLPRSRTVDLGAIAASGDAPLAGSEDDGGPLPPPRGGGPRMVSLTLLDGTTITLPAREKKKKSDPPSVPPDDLRGLPAPEGGQADEGALTARDLVAALRAVAHGADATEILGSNTRWETMFAALLSVLLKKHLIADWEFVDEYKKI